MKPLNKFLTHAIILGLILFTLTPMTAAVASMTCNAMSTNFCSIDRSRTYQVFCQNPKGHTYEGSINCEGKWQGQGTYTHPTGQVYKGEYRNGKRHGHGTIIYKSGNKYVGGWRFSKEDGYGHQIFTNGDSYKGQFKNGEKHGPGTYYFSSGDYTEQQYSNGTKIGTETYYFSDGRITRFQIENGERGQRTVIKSSADIRREKEEKRQREEKLAQQRQKEREAAEKQRKLREAKAKEEKLEVDSCLLNLYVDDGSWSENSARQLCRIAIKQSHNAIMANCILDKGYKKPTSVFDSVQNVCEQISINPGWLDQLKYSTPLSEYLTKLK